MQIQTTFARAKATKYPEQVAIAIARNSAGKCNPITLGWIMPTSHDPPMFAISVGKTRYSLDVIRTAGEFVIAFPSEGQKEETMLFGTKSGRNADKLVEAGSATQPAGTIDCVLLCEAVANFECKLVGELDTGDHVIFVGEVICSHVHQTPLNRLYTIGENYRMGGVRRADGA